MLKPSDKILFKEFKYYTPLAILFASILLISNTIAVKLFIIKGFVFTGGVIAFPICYILGDILTEVYGYARARRVIWIGFLANILMISAYWIIIAMPPAEFWPHQQAISQILGQVPRIVLASIVGYIVGEFSNSYVLAKIKIFTKGKYLWIRIIVSTIVGEGIDTTLFILIAFGWVYPFQHLLDVILAVYLIKVLYEFIFTPITSIMANFLKKQEQCDYFDHHTSFSPFKW